MLLRRRLRSDWGRMHLSDGGCLGITVTWACRCGHLVVRWPTMNRWRRGHEAQTCLVPTVRSVTCFVVARSHRGRGITTELLKAAAGFARRCGRESSR
ncbi:MAG TPA: hypothetical protein DCE44_19100 [Verrucomicrobiales bacterium]|nr:hypothetical protein [Verrucomicrobiales bacterium]